MNRVSTKRPVNNPKGNRANLTNEGKGRPRGVPNKFTGTLKEAILSAFDRVGGVDYLEIQARENPQAFMSLIAKVLPMQVTGPNDGPILLITGVVRDGDLDETIQASASVPMPRPRALPASPAATSHDLLSDPGSDPVQDEPLPDMRAVAITRSGARFREVPPVQPTHEGRTVTTESGQRVRTVQSLDA